VDIEKRCTIVQTTRLYFGKTIVQIYNRSSLNTGPSTIAVSFLTCIVTRPCVIRDTVRITICLPPDNAQLHKPDSVTPCSLPLASTYTTTCPLCRPSLLWSCSTRGRREFVCNSLSASSTPTKFVVVSCPCSSRRVCSFDRVFLGPFSAQVQQQRKRCFRSPRSSWSGFVFIFGRTVFGLGLLCLSWGLLLLFQYTIFRSHCASLCKPRLDSEPRVWPSSSSARTCALRPDHFFGVRHGRGQRGGQWGRQPPLPRKRGGQPSTGRLRLTPARFDSFMLCLGGAHYAGYYI
jgi:hypothetical protein